MQFHDNRCKSHAHALYLLNTNELIFFLPYLFVLLVLPVSSSRCYQPQLQPSKTIENQCISMIITTNRMQSYENHSRWMPKILLTKFQSFYSFCSFQPLYAQDTINRNFSHFARFSRCMPKILSNTILIIVIRFVRFTRWVLNHFQIHQSIKIHPNPTKSMNTNAVP